MSRHILPADFVNRIRHFHGITEEDFLKGMETEVPVSVRMNPFKPAEIFSGCEPVQWASVAFYLPQRISFTLDPLFHAGCYYVQEASSMYLETVLRKSADINQSLKVLDLCAAPGGKSTHLLSLLSPDSLLVSNEVIPARNKVLQQNLTSWGASNRVVTQNKAADFQRLSGFFDVLVVDVPCSGEGLFRKDPDAANEWSEQNVEMCSRRQAVILQEVTGCLKEGGVLIYSTCTFESSENDDQIRKLIADGSFELIEIPAPSGVVRTEFGLQFYPHLINGEGFYIAAVRKTHAANHSLKKSKIAFAEKHRAELKKWLRSDSGFLPYAADDQLYAIPKHLTEDFAILKSNLYLRLAGIHLGKMIRDEIIPEHDLAMSVELSERIRKIELDINDAISYLRCDTVKVDSSAEPGWCVVTYQNHPLGWIKVLKGRTNNYFPVSQRILMRP
jgi:16S rRNA C967 or C1407 C5-methylase (RsmB/RsmF family)/NOL1/NOP2/fmu family ribosome biogenesis protein